MRKTNFSNISVRGETKKEIDELKRKLSNEYLSDATYDDLINIFLRKNKKIVLSPNEFKELFVKSRGIRFND